MPVVFHERGYRFHFFSSKGDPREPPHIHVAKRGVGDAKLWLYPDVRIAYNYRFDARIERWIIGITKARRTEIEGVA